MPGSSAVTGAGNGPQARRPPETSGTPPGIPYIIGNEAAERFSYYGMKTILVVFMTSALVDASGRPSPMTEAEATTWYHLFGVANYFFPFLGALLADIYWGKYRTIIRLSLVYCAGHLALAADGTRQGLAIGLFLIALGAGGIKPCVSAHVGDQFTAKNAHLIPRAFAYFYLAINLGGFLSSILTPLLLEHYGPHIAFGVPGILMCAATFVFWLGRHYYVTIPPAGLAAYKEAIFSSTGKKSFIRLAVAFSFISIFWALFDQTGSTWVLQAQKMDRTVGISLGGLSGTFEPLPSQLQALNPLLILLLVPLFSKKIYPFLQQSYSDSAVPRIFAGMLFGAASFVIIAYAQYRLEQGETVSVYWQCLGYLFVTVGEILVSITALEFAYTQAPPALKSFMMSFYMLSVSLGNAITTLINSLLTGPGGELAVARSNYFLIFVVLMVVTAFAFRRACKSFGGEMYLHERTS